MSIPANNLANASDNAEAHVFTVLVFGPVAQTAGERELRVSVRSARPSCAELRAAVTQQYPALASVLPACRFAVNDAFASESQIVQPSDDIALIGLVSGG
jgi:molybdopterin synthase catalytic subunit